MMMWAGGEPNPGEDVGRGEPNRGAEVAAGEPNPGAEVAGASRAVVQMRMG